VASALPPAISERTAGTWNDAERIAAHRRMSADERLRLTIEVSRAVLRFADGVQVSDERRDPVRT
jgi:hypothetical protein